MTETDNKTGRKTFLRVLNIAITVVLVLAVAFVVARIFFVTWLTVNQRSMYPTYEEGETVFVNRLGSVERGCVAVYFDEDVSVPHLASAFGWGAGDAKMLIKRVIALEGDKLWLSETDGGYVINIADPDGTIYQEEYEHDGEAVTLDPITLYPDTAGVLSDATRFDPYVVGDGCVFMVGDNRRESQDSRVFGDVPLSRVIGIVMN